MTGRRKLAPDRVLLATFRQFGISGVVTTWIDGGTRYFGVSPDEYRNIPARADGVAGVVDLGSQLLALSPEKRVSVGDSAPLTGALDFRKLGCPICDRHEPGAGLHTNCILR